MTTDSGARGIGRSIEATGRAQSGSGSDSYPERLSTGYRPYQKPHHNGTSCALIRLTA